MKLRTAIAAAILAAGTLAAGVLPAAADPKPQKEIKGDGIIVVCSVPGPHTDIEFVVI